jgi:hypothetical protein
MNQTCEELLSKVENILIKSGLFRLDGKKQAIGMGLEHEVLVIDVAEHEIERPKKTEEKLQR